MFCAYNTPNRLVILIFIFPQYTKKAQVLFSAHPGITGLRIAQLTQDRQRSLAHASTLYIFRVYTYTHNADASVVICLL